MLFRSVATSYGLLDPNPIPGEQILSRNYGRAPGQIMLNLRIAKTIGFGAERGTPRKLAPGLRGLFSSAPGDRRYTLNVAMSIRNLLNHTNRGAIVGNIGWGRSEVVNAASAAMGTYTVPLWPTTARLALIDELVQHWLPAGFDNVFFTSGGSESTDSALRLARAYQLGKGRPDRWKIIGRHPSYHGMTLATMAAASHTGRQAGYEPVLLPFPKVAWNDPQSVIDTFEREDPATIAGFIAEPITGAAGACLTASDHYWRTVTELCRKHDVLLIADEVMTGYGRTGLPFGHQHFPFEPDVIVGGKGLGGGYMPLGAVATRGAVADSLRNAGFMFFT